MTEKAWRIIEKGNMHPQLYSFAEMQIIRPKLASRSIIICNGMEPLYGHDEEGFLLVQSSYENKSDLKRKIKKTDNIETDIFVDSEFNAVFTANNPTNFDSFLTSESKDSIFKKIGLFFLKKKYKHYLFWLVLCVVLINYSNINKIITQDSIILRAQSMPNSLQAFEAAIEAKLNRDGKKYALALLEIERVRPFFSAAEIPSPNFIASLAMANLDNNELDKNEQWPKLLASLGDRAKTGIPVLAYETAKIENILNNFSFEKGRSFEVENTKIVNSLITIYNVFDNIYFTEKILRNRLAARAVWSALLAQWYNVIKNGERVNQNITSKAFVLAGKIPTPDRQVLLAIYSEIVQKPIDDIGVIAKKRMLFIDALQKEFGFLCNPDEGEIVGEFMLHSLEIKKEYKALLPKFTPVLEKCFVGYRKFFPTKPSSFLEIKQEPIAFSLPLNATFEKRKKIIAPLFDEYGVFKKAEINNKDIFSFAVWQAQIGWNKAVNLAEGANKFCKSLQKTTIYCLNVRWVLASKVSEKIEILRDLSEVLPKETVHNVAVNLAAELLTEQRKFYNNKLLSIDEYNAVFKEIKYFMNEEGEEYNTIEWFFQNHIELK